MRVTRSGYIGAVAGGAVMFAQQGGIETILKSSNGTGLAERFLFLAEKHNLGKRDFSQNHSIDYELIKAYNAVCEQLMTSVIESPRELEDLSVLVICPKSWQLIAQFRAKIEPFLADGGRYAHISLRGAASKIDMQIMKLATLLHLLDNFERNSMTIAVKHVEAAIAIAHAMMEANLKICTDKGIVGVKAEFTAILKMFEGKTKPLTEREIIMSRKNITPFKDFTGNKSELIKSTLAEMVAQGLLSRLYDPSTPSKVLYSMAQ
jgi:DNA-binding HxlR family transcriptional regulator